jgi:hypothetical protein
MNHNLFWLLVRKDLRLSRDMILITLAVGAFSLFLMTRGTVLYYIGCVIALSALVIHLIFLVQLGLMMERKERVHLFILSLPITGQQYVLAKLVALSSAFFAPFLLIAATSLALIAWYPPSRGFLPFAATILMYFPMYFAVLFSVTASAKSDGANIAAVIFFNIAINLVIPGVMRIPSVAATIGGTEVVWTPELLLIIALEVGVGACAILLLLWRQRNKTEFL